jgi:hypothetical protein
LADAVDELRVGLNEVRSRLLRIFEVAALSGGPGPLAFEEPSVKLGRALSGKLGQLQRGGTGLEVFAASVEVVSSGPVSLPDARTNREQWRVILVSRRGLR